MTNTSRAAIIIAAILLLAASGVWYAKRRLLWNARPADAIPIAQKERTPLDLRPATIARLQGLVQEGSEGLYKLRIDSLLTDIASGTIVLKGVGLYPDSNAIRALHEQKKLPDDIFQLELESLRISGIDLADILNRRDMHVRAIVCDGANVVVHHQRQPYNADERAAAKGKSLFARLNNQLDRLAIDSVALMHSNITDRSGGRKEVYKDVSVALSNVLIDSAAELDKTRFLFAKQLLLEAGDIRLPVGASNYDLGIGAIRISGGEQQLDIRNLTLKPHSGREAFLRLQKEQVEVYDIELPALHLRGTDWWAAVHGESLLADEVELDDATINVYLDQRMPASAEIKRDNFPQQMLADAGLNVSLKRVTLKNAVLNYDELTKRSGVQSRLTFSAINAVAEGVSNMAGEIKKHPDARLRGSCRLMNAATMTGDFLLALSRNRKGAFTADLTMGAMSHDAVNPFSEGMGLVRFTGGDLQEATAHIAGNNDWVNGRLSARYTDLHIEPLKTKEDQSGRLKGKKITRTIANSLFVKDNNPSKGKLRQPEFSLDRTKEGNFFNFVWMGLKAGLLKTLGVPLKLGM